MSELPPGFELDQPAPQTQSALPDGFVLDQPAPKRGAVNQLIGIGGSRYQTWPERLVRGIGSELSNAATVPGRVYQGEIAPDSPEAIRAGATIALTPGLMGPMSPGAVIGSRYGAPPVVTRRTVETPQDVALTSGQATGDVSTIRTEQSARRGLLGDEARKHATAFDELQNAQVQTVKDRIGQSFDQFGQDIASSPQEAGSVVQKSMQRAASGAKEATTDLYTAARTAPGEISPQAAQSIAVQVRSTLPALEQPVIVDEKLTPYASAAIGDIDKTISALQGRKAGEYGKPDQTGLTLNDVDIVRKRLSAFRKQAFSSGNASDGSATQAVVNAFDDAIDRAVNSGQFSGDQSAIKAWNTARQSHADYQKTFTSAGPKDLAGKYVERIIGNRGNDPAIPNDVADFLYGSSGVNPSTVNVAVTNRLKSTLGEQSPEWSAVKQGLFSRLSEKPEGVTDFGPGAIAQRLNNFLNGDGKEMSQVVYSPQERQLIQQFADLNRKLEIPRGGANYSETSTFVGPYLKKIISGTSAVIGAIIGHSTGIPGAEAAGAFVGGKGAQFVKEASDMRLIRRQMPLIIESANKWNRAVRALTLANTPINRVAVATATKGMLRNLQLAGIAGKEVGGMLPAYSGNEQDYEQPKR